MSPRQLRIVLLLAVVTTVLMNSASVMGSDPVDVPLIGAVLGGEPDLVLGKKRRLDPQNEKDGTALSRITFRLWTREAEFGIPGAAGGSSFYVKGIGTGASVAGIACKDDGRDLSCHAALQGDDYPEGRGALGAPLGELTGCCRRSQQRHGMLGT